MIKVLIQGQLCQVQDRHWTCIDVQFAEDLNKVQESLERSRPKDGDDLWAAEAMIDRLGGRIVDLRQHEGTKTY